MARGFIKGQKQGACANDRRGKQTKRLSSGFAIGHRKGKTEIITVLVVKRMIIYFLYKFDCYIRYRFCFPYAMWGENQSIKNKPEIPEL